MSVPHIAGLLFFGLAALAVLGAAGVAFSRNIVRSAFSLLATLLGVAGLYALLSADLVAVIQLMVYVGGVLVVILFAVMLTARLADIRLSNPTLGFGTGLGLMVPLTALLVWMSVEAPPSELAAVSHAPTAAAIGEALLGPYVLPFEAVSVLLLAALVGAVVLARGWGIMPRRRRPDRSAPSDAPGGNP